MNKNATNKKVREHASMTMNKSLGPSIKMWDKKNTMM